MGSLQPDHYRVHVNRGPLPSIAKLKQEFPGGVTYLYDGRSKWTKHSCRSDTNDVTAEDVVMVLKQFTAQEIEEMAGLESKNIITWGLKHDLVPADEREVLAWGLNPETRNLQGQSWILGLGSFTFISGERYLSGLNADDRGRILDHTWYVVFAWPSDRRFLFVRK